MKRNRKTVSMTHSIRFGDRELIWQVPRLWSLSKNLPVMEVKIDSLNSDVFEKDRWFEPYEKPIIANIIKHCMRIERSDFKYPIILSPTNSVMDGTHRVAKAYIMGEKTIKAVRFSHLPHPDEIKFLETTKLSRFGIFKCSKSSYKVGAIFIFFMAMIVLYYLLHQTCECNSSTTLKI